MDQTPNLALPYIAPSQAQKHVTHNEALRALDAVLQIGVLDRDAAEPPASPEDGDRYVVAPDPTGEWAGHVNHIAAWQDGAWMFYEPRKGWLAWVADEGRLCAWNGDSWGVAGTGEGGGDSSLETLGINATADTTNRLVVASAASLFNHEGAGHQHKINKKLATDTASVLFQTDFSGRAEFGIAGDDDFHVKVSADGASWKDALVIDRVTGLATFPFTPRREVLTANRTYYVRTDGSDGNDGLTNSAGGALATIQRAIDVACALDLSIYAVTISVADGSYAAITLKKYLGAGPISIVGNPSTPANVLLSLATRCVTAMATGCVWNLQGMKLETTSGDCLRAYDGAIVNYRDIDFGACPNSTSSHVVCYGGATVNANGNYAISGGAYRHWWVESQGFLQVAGRTVTLTGTPAFRSAFAVAQMLALVQCNSDTFSGAATGKKYNVGSNAIISGGGGASYLPGNSDGMAANGGQYI